MNFVLCGMMGSGKSRLGKNIAAKTGRNWIDTDELIVRKFGQISKIFAEKGEGYFRDLETEIAEELSRKDGLVISTGGGFVLRKINAELLKRNGKILFLRAEKQTLLSRLVGDTDRPLLQGEDLESKIDRLLKERAPVYERVANFVLDVDGYSVEENTERAIEKFLGDK